MECSKIAIIGAGRAGSAMALALKKAGYEIVSVYSRSYKAAADLAAEVKAAALQDAAKAAASAQIVLIAVPDRAIVQVAQEIAAAGGFQDGQVVYHLSGAQTAESLKAAQVVGAFTGSLHPLLSIAEPHVAAQSLSGAYFAVDGDLEAVRVAKSLIQDIGGKSFCVPPEKRALYHAAACMASNYMVVLVESAVEVLEKVGITKEQATEALEPLLQATLSNIRQLGPRNALTGPIARGDTATVERHLKQLRIAVPGLEPLYQALGQKAMAAALQYGYLEEKQAVDLKRILK